MGRRRYTLRAAAVLAVASHPGAPSLFRRAEGKFVAATRQRRAQEHGLGREFLDPTVGGIVNRFAVGRRREALRGSFLKAWGWKRSVRADWGAGSGLCGVQHRDCRPSPSFFRRGIGVTHPAHARQRHPGCGSVPVLGRPVLFDRRGEGGSRAVGVGARVAVAGRVLLIPSA